MDGQKINVERVEGDPCVGDLAVVIAYSTFEGDTIVQVDGYVVDLVSPAPDRPGIMAVMSRVLIDDVYVPHRALVLWRRAGYQDVGVIYFRNCSQR